MSLPAVNITAKLTQMLEAEPSADNIGPDMRRLLEHIAAAGGTAVILVGAYLAACGLIARGFAELVHGSDPAAVNATLRLTERGKAVGAELLARREAMHRMLDVLLDVQEHGGWCSLELGPFGVEVCAMSAEQYRQTRDGRVPDAGVRFEGDTLHEVSARLLDADSRGEI